MLSFSTSGNNFSAFFCRPSEFLALLALSTTLFLFLHTRDLQVRLKEMETKATGESAAASSRGASALTGEFTFSILQITCCKKRAFQTLRWVVKPFNCLSPPPPRWNYNCSAHTCTRASFLDQDQEMRIALAPRSHSYPIAPEQPDRHSRFITNG